MRTIRRTFANLSKSTLLLGKAGENLVTRLEIDVSKELNEFPNAVFELVLKTPAYADPYPVVIDVSNNKINYSFSGTDLAQSGFGELEALVCGLEGEVLKSTTAKTKIDSSIISPTYSGPLQKIIEDIKEYIKDLLLKTGIKAVEQLPESASENDIVYLEGVGIYRYTTEWTRITVDDLESTVNSLSSSVDSMSSSIPSADQQQSWDSAVAYKHTHSNKDALDKLIVSPSFAELPNAADGTVAFVYGLESGTKSAFYYDPSTDNSDDLAVATVLTYDENEDDFDGAAKIQHEDGEEPFFVYGFFPVVESSDSEDGYGMFGLRLVANSTKNYTVGIYADTTDTIDVETLFDDLQLDEPSAIDLLFFVYAFENTSAYLDSEDGELPDLVSLYTGWNVIAIGEGEEEETEVVFGQVSNPNDYITFGEVNKSVGYNEVGEQSYLRDVIVVNVDAEDKRGVYSRSNGQWVRDYENEINNLDTRLSSLENGKPDDVQLLGFETYDDLVVRDEVFDNEGIQDVPVYTGGVEEICRLSDGNNYVSLQEVRDETSDITLGSAVRVIIFHQNGNGQSNVSSDFNGRSWIRIYGMEPEEKGWRGGRPTISLTPDRFIVNGSIYYDLDGMPADAKSALRSLSQCINVSKEAMGTISVPDDAVERFADTLKPNHKYYFEAVLGTDLLFDLPSVPFSVKDAQIVIYLKCANYVDVSFPVGTRFAGEINTDEGYHKLICSWIRELGVWSVGCVDYEVDA